MGISVTPFVYLLNLGIGASLCGMFIAAGACKRMGVKNRSRVAQTDKVNISASVIITSLFLMWSAGSVLAAYFGEYPMFGRGMPSAYNTLQKTDIFIDIFQKFLYFSILGISAFQSERTGNEETLLPWGKCCLGMGALQFLILLISQGCFQGAVGWIIMYMLGAGFDLIVCVFSVLTAVLISKNKQTPGVKGYYPKKISLWNTQVCLGVFFSSLLDLISKSAISYMAVNSNAAIQLLIDLSMLLRGLATFTAVSLAYSAKIPPNKSYSPNEE